MQVALCKGDDMAYRIQHKFWLDIERDSEADLNDLVVDLKRRRSFVSTVRDGIRLIADLRSGNVDVLLELFPWIQSELASGGAGGDDDMIDVREQLERLEHALLGQNNGALMAPVASGGGPTSLAVPQVAGPVIDDDDDMPVLIVTKSKANGNASENFLAAAFALQ